MSTAAFHQEINYFPRIKAGIARNLKESVHTFIVVAWLLIIDMRAFLEDLEGGIDQPELLAILKLRLVELFLEIDLRLSGAALPDEIHFLALSMELGYSEIAALPGESIVNSFDLATVLTDEGTEIESVQRFAQAILDNFPGELPDPLTPQGQGMMLRMLRDWTSLCKTAELDLKFLESLMKQI